MKMNYGKTFLIGFGFLASSIAWAVYNAYVPIILEGFVSSTFVIGMIMTIDNVFGVVFQPVFGHLSDKTHSKLGKRMPFIVIGIPICAVLFVLIPFMRTIVMLMLVVIAFNFVMSTWRAPVVALMPDFTPSPLRSKANGIINLMGGLGTLIVFVAGGMLFNMGGMPLPFIFAAIIMIAAAFVLRFGVKAPPSTSETEAKETQLRFRDLPKTEKTTLIKSLLFILLAILFWFVAYSAVETFFTLYATNTLVGLNGGPVTAGDASILLGVFSLTFLAFALPAGILGTKFGRKKIIMLGLVGIVAIFAVMYALSVTLPAVSIVTVAILLLLGGVCWGAININSYPMVVDMGTEKTTGLYTGFYYIASFSASVISPILFGAIRDAVNDYKILFLYSAIAFAVAFIMMIFVKRGEAKPMQGIEETTEMAA